MESDANGDGTIDLGEFIELMKRKSSETDQMEVSKWLLLFFKYKKTKTIACLGKKELFSDRENHAGLRNPRKESCVQSFGSFAESVSN